MTHKHKKELAAIKRELVSLKDRVECLKEEGTMDPKITAALSQLDADVVTLAAQQGTSNVDVPAIVAAINSSDAKVQAAIKPGVINSPPATGAVISGISPASGALGASVVITGTGFGLTPGTLTFNGVPAAVGTWTDTLITTAVPAGASTGPVVVNGSAGVTFTVA